MVNPSVVHGHRGVGVAIVRCFFVLRWFKNPLRPRRSGEAYGTRSMTACRCVKDAKRTPPASLGAQRGLRGNAPESYNRLK